MQKDVNLFFKYRKSIIRYIIVLILLVIMVFTYFIIVNNNEVEGSYYDSIANIENLERNNPNDFLELQVKYKTSFWGSKLILNCIIINSATLVTYKDIVIRVDYFSKTKTLLGSKDYTVYELFKPNSTNSFTIEADNFKDVSYIETSIYDVVYFR